MGNNKFEVVGQVLNWSMEEVRVEFDSLIRHMEEDALTQSELAMLSVCAWRLAYE